MVASIQKAVGEGAPNLRDDVVTVQTLLIQHGFASLAPADGICGKRTVKAIEAFQRKFSKLPDRRVDPNGRSWRHLLAFEHHPPEVKSPFLRLVPCPAKATINTGIVPVSNTFMKKTLGDPRPNYTPECQPVTDARLKRAMVIKSVGKFRVQGLSPAVDSLLQVFNDVRTELPDLYEQVGTAGMLCCRLQRGGTSISNHSWGTAVDLTIAGVLDVRGDNKVQVGLTLLCPIFNRHGWYWGAAFPTEDGMHFEAGKALVEAWAGTLK